MNSKLIDTEAVFLRRLLDKIEERGLDIHQFRRSYVERRINSRIRVTGCTDILSYSKYLEKHAGEYPLLLDALTTNVTEFFRDADVYQELEQRIIPGLIADGIAQGRHHLRLWSAGCSSGEETYTLAMIVARCLENVDADLHCTIYGTDIDDASLAAGRQAEYPIRNLQSIPDRYRNYVVPKGASTFTFTSDVLSRVRFKKLNLFVDKLLKQVEVVLCRNVMIYFAHGQQEQLIERFHQSIVPGGCLIIGKSEKFQDSRGAFVPVSTRCRIYRKPGRSVASAGVR